MTIEMVMVKTQDGRLAPVSESDTEQLRKIKIGKGFRVALTQQSERSLAHHKMFFGGLIPLAIEYWEPISGGFIQPSERKILREFCRQLEIETGRGGNIKAFGKMFIDDLAKVRADRLPGNQKGVEDFLYWLKMEAKHYDVIQTPSGLLFKVKSINFNSMSQEEFNDFYKKCFDVCWNMILNKVFGGDQAKCEQVINELMSMG